MHSSQHALVTTRTRHNTHMSQHTLVTRTECQWDIHSSHALVTRTRTGHTHNQHTPSSHAQSVKRTRHMHNQHRLSIRHAPVETRTRHSQHTHSSHELIVNQTRTRQNKRSLHSFTCVTWLIHMCDMTHSYVWHDSGSSCPLLLNSSSSRVYAVATSSRLLKIIGLFCKRALSKRRYSAKETYNFKEPTTSVWGGYK